MHRSLPLAAALLLSLASPGRGQALPDDPYAYDVRIALFPVAFVAGVSQSAFGSAARAEADLGRRVTLQLAGRIGWAELAGETDPTLFGGRLALSLHFDDRRVEERLGGTVYPEDAPATGGAGRGTDTDLEVPMSQKLGGPRMRLPEKDLERVAPVRRVQSLRLGADYTRSVQLARPAGDLQRHVLNTVPSLFLGYGWGVHYNLSSGAQGEHEVGFRRYFVDAMLTLESMVETEQREDDLLEAPNDFFPVGVRIGMEGTIGALFRSAPGVGLGYSLELGALPGESGVEGYLLLGLGLSTDLSTAPTRPRR